MKTKKQRKITVAQVRALEKKLIVLEHRRCHIVSQTTPLKIILGSTSNKTWERYKHS